MLCKVVGCSGVRVFSRLRCSVVIRSTHSLAKFMRIFWVMVKTITLLSVPNNRLLRTESFFAASVRFFCTAANAGFNFTHNRFLNTAGDVFIKNFFIFRYHRTTLLVAFEKEDNDDSSPPASATALRGPGLAGWCGEIIFSAVDSSLKIGLIPVYAEFNAG